MTMQEEQTIDKEVLHRVLDISLQMAQTRELDPLLYYVMEQAVDFSGGQHGYLVLLNEDNTLDFRVKYGEPDNEHPFDEEGRLVSRSIIEDVITTREPRLVSDAAKDSRYSTKTSIVDLQLQSVLCVPLLARGRLLGVLYVENRQLINAFTDKNINPLVIFAGQAAIAIENAQLNEQQERFAHELELRVQERTAELEEARRAAELGWESALEANRLRTALLSNIAHDLRSPLNTVINILDVVRNGEFGEVNPDQRDWLERAIGSARQIDRLAGDVFDLAKLEQGKLQLYMEPQSVDGMVQQAISVAQVMNRKRGIQTLVEVEPNLPPVMADFNRVQQILVNLLANATKYTYKGTITLRAAYAEQEGFILFSVADTGEGIAPDEIGKLFKRFQQVDSDAKRRQTGTGLGLAICKELVDYHGGQIWVESQPGLGSTFYFTLPIAQSVAELSPFTTD